MTWLATFAHRHRRTWLRPPGRRRPPPEPVRLAATHAPDPADPWWAWVIPPAQTPTPPQESR